MSEKTNVLEVDREHRALQATVMLSFFIGAALIYLLVSLIMRVDGINLIAAAASFLGGFLVSRALEMGMRDRWPSGRRLYLEDSHYLLKKRMKLQQEIRVQETATTLFWRFRVKRGGRIPKGWFLVSCAIEQEGDYLAAYTFMPEDEYEEMPLAERFIELAPRKKLAEDGDFRLLGQQKRLHTAEVFRWNEGAELNRDDFRTYIQRVVADFG